MCLYRNSFFVIRKVVGFKVIYLSDIGCYIFGVFLLFRMVDIMVVMGVFIGIGYGFSIVMNGLFVEEEYKEGKEK